jgi:hypothetical protein
MDVLTAALDGWTEMARRVAGSGAGTKPNAGSPSSQPTANTSAERIAKRRIVLSGKGPGPERSAGPTSLLTVHPVAGKRPSGPFQQEGDEPGRRALSGAILDPLTQGLERESRLDGAVDVLAHGVDMRCHLHRFPRFGIDEMRLRPDQLAIRVQLAEEELAPRSEHARGLEKDGRQVVHMLENEVGHDCVHRRRRHWPGVANLTFGVGMRWCARAIMASLKSIATTDRACSARYSVFFPVPLPSSRTSRFSMASGARRTTMASRSRVAFLSAS